MAYTHLSIYEQGRIEELFRIGYSKREIAVKLKQSTSIIYREQKRNFSAKAIMVKDTDLS